MSKYTIEVRYICETESGLTASQGANSVDDIISKSVNKIFNFNFPIFDEKYREVLEKKILKHYYTREIAFESIGLWVLKLNTKLNEIMPYYNKLYESELLEFNPFYTHNLTRKHENTSNLSSNSTNISSGNSEGTSYDLYSDTPQGSLYNVDNQNYLTNARKNLDNTKSNGTITSNGGVNTTEKYIESVAGYESINGSELLLKYRDTFLNIDMLVINELEDLFFQLW